MSYKHLSFPERFVIEVMMRKKVSIREIAVFLGRSPNTVSREIAKQKKKTYSAKKAQRRAYFQRYRSKRPCLKVAMNAFLIRFVQEKLEAKWSPKQISGYLKDMELRVSAKAIYKFAKSRGLDHLLFWNWNKHKRGQKKYRYDQPRDNRKYIAERPKMNGFGHWEMDFIVSRQSSFVLLVVVEKMSKKSFVKILPNRKRTTIGRALRKMFRGKLVKSITTDNDIAFQNWRQLEEQLKTSIYFCHPYHSWEKGLVENTNRWIRCFVPKKKDIARVTKKDLQNIDAFVNKKPREVLGFETADDVYYKLMQCPT
jgi:IS30 family transposase